MIRPRRSLLALSLLLAAAAPAQQWNILKPFNVSFDGGVASAIMWDGAPAIVVAGARGEAAVAAVYPNAKACPANSSLIGLDLVTEAVFAYETRPCARSATLFLWGWALTTGPQGVFLVKRGPGNSLPTIYWYAKSQWSCVMQERQAAWFGYCTDGACTGTCPDRGPELWAVVFSIRYAAR